MEQFDVGADKSFIQYFLSSRGLDIPFIIRECFLGYKYRKAEKKLYEESATIPTNLIILYYLKNYKQLQILIQNKY